MTSPVATILVPTHDHGPTLRASVASALRQTVSDIEVFIVGDGFRTLAEGARVEYDTEAGNKGPKAVGVRLV